jgi:hypothetical protein
MISGDGQGTTSDEVFKALEVLTGYNLQDFKNLRDRHIDEAGQMPLFVKLPMRRFAIFGMDVIMLSNNIIGAQTESPKKILVQLKERKGLRPSDMPRRNI